MKGRKNKVGNEIFKKGKNIRTCWANMENPECIKGKAASSNNGRKGSPAIRPLSPGQSAVLAHAKGSGIIRHIWITFENREKPEMLKSLKLECFWDGEEKPAVSVPLGDFFCTNLGIMTPFENVFYSNPEGRSFNCYVPMPFKTEMKIVVINESDILEQQFFYQIDYTLGDEFDEDTLYFHAFYNRESNTKALEDYTILPEICGNGRYLGASFGVICNPLMKETWWGEGEVKCYIDGDTDLPSLAGTGTEDYIGTGWGQGVYNHKYQGCLIADKELDRYSFYRFHEPDPVYFNENIRITIQQIACSGFNGLQNVKNSGLKVLKVGSKTEYVDFETTFASLFERFDDDWSSIAYFYLDKPVTELPQLEDVGKRVLKHKKTVKYE